MNPDWIGTYAADNTIETHPTLQSCVVCCRALGQMVPKTIDVQGHPATGKRNHFFRVHESCWIKLTASEKAAYRASVADWRPA